MRVKKVARQQYQAIVDKAAPYAVAMSVPSEGWLRTARKALGMSGAQLARRLGLTRARIAHAEQDEISGSVTLKSMQAAAEAMGCKFVYAIVPPKTVEDLISAQAHKKAVAIVNIAGEHMALESQLMPDKKIREEVERLARDIAHEIPPNLWDEK
jgi:predicted DNA-binding mobile mystery protein A